MTAEALLKETQDDNPATVSATPAHTARPLQAHESEAVRHLARAIGGLTTTIRAVASGRDLHAPYTLESLGWTEDSMSEYDRLARSSRKRGRGQKRGRDIDRTAEGSASLTREAVQCLSQVAETVTQALEALAAGASLGSADTLRHLIMADAQLTDLVRMIPEDEYTGTIREVWGREAMPVRLR